MSITTFGDICMKHLESPTRSRSTLLSEMPGRVKAVTILPLLLLVAACASPPGEIDAWPITGAQESEFSGTVVDLLCELNGNCTDNCGEGNRQLGVKTDSLGTVLVAKNLTDFSGAADELWNYCGQVVDVNGLFTTHQGVRFFQVQNVRPPEGKWLKATRYSEAWVARSGKDAGMARNWHEHDERVKAIIKRDGYLGLGQQADDEYFE